MTGRSSARGDSLLSKLGRASDLYESTEYEEALSILREVQSDPSNITGIAETVFQKLMPLVTEKVAEKYRTLRDFEKSLSLYEELLTMQAWVDEKDTLRVKRAIGFILLELGRHQESCDILTTALSREKKLFGTEDMYGQNNLAQALQRLERFQESISIFRLALNKGMRTLDKDNKFIMSIQTDLALALLRTHKHEESLKLFQEYLEKKKRLSRSDDLEAQADILRTKNNIATVLIELGRYPEAHLTLNKVWQTDQRLFAAAHFNARETLALLFYRQNMIQDCLSTYREIIQEMKEKQSGSVSLDMLITQYNLGEVLMEVDQLEEALEIFKEVQANRRRIPGLDFREGLFVQDNIVKIQLAQEKHAEAWSFLERELEWRKERFGLDSLYTLATQYWMAQVSVRQNKLFRALQLLERVYLGRRATLGFEHEDTQEAKANLDLTRANYENSQERIDELKLAKLHRAIKSGSVAAVNDSLAEGIDLSQVTATKGNTALHIAALNGNNIIVRLILDHAKQRLEPTKLAGFVNAQTTSGKNTALHVAAKQGDLEVAKSLLECGAIYCVKNNEGKTPVDEASAENVSALFKLIDELFQNTEAGRSETLAIRSVRDLTDEEFSAVTSARNSLGHTLFLNALRNKQKGIADEISKLLKKRASTNNEKSATPSGV